MREKFEELKYKYATCPNVVFVEDPTTIFLAAHLRRKIISYIDNDKLSCTEPLSYNRFDDNIDIDFLISTFDYLVFNLYNVLPFDSENFKEEDCKIKISFGNYKNDIGFTDVVKDVSFVRFHSFQDGELFYSFRTTAYNNLYDVRCREFVFKVNPEPGFKYLSDTHMVYLLPQIKEAFDNKTLKEIAICP